MPSVSDAAPALGTRGRGGVGGAPSSNGSIRASLRPSLRMLLWGLAQGVKGACFLVPRRSTREGVSRGCQGCRGAVLGWGLPPSWASSSVIQPGSL